MGLRTEMEVAAALDDLPPGGVRLLKLTFLRLAECCSATSISSSGVIAWLLLFIP
jgi:hypothetical protein